MPTVFIQKGYRFHFYAADLDEPIHVHVVKGGRSAKFWMHPIRIAVNKGFREHELSEIARIIDKHSASILARWRQEKDKRNDLQG